MDEITILRTDNSPFERVEQFKYLGAALTDRSSVQEEINLLKPNNIYISYRTANLQTLHFKYLFNKYTY